MLPDLYIAIPTVRDWKPEFGISMIALTFHLSKLAREGKIRGFYVNNKITSNLPKGRQMMLDDAMKGEFTHILWIDDDTGFDPKCFDLMLSRDKDYIAANICRKSKEGGWIAVKDGGLRVNSTGAKGIEKIATMGLGFTLVRLDAVRDIPAPHFEMRWMDEARGYLGEDLYFCLKAKEKGVDIWIDHDASQLIRHVGNYGYGPDDIEPIKQEEAA